MTKKEAIAKVYGMSGTKEQHEALEFLIPEVHRLREFYETKSTHYDKGKSNKNCKRIHK